MSCALFLGTEKVRILDRRDFHGDVPTMIDDAVAWILTKINVEFFIRHVRREERPELPEEALREAVANGVAHRDYRSTANVQIYVQGPDRDRQSGRVAGGNDRSGSRRQEHAPEPLAVRDVVPDGRRLGDQRSRRWTGEVREPGSVESLASQRALVAASEVPVGTRSSGVDRRSRTGDFDWRASPAIVR